MDLKPQNTGLETFEKDWKVVVMNNNALEAAVFFSEIEKILLSTL